MCGVCGLCCSTSFAVLDVKARMDRGGALEAAKAAAVAHDWVPSGAVQERDGRSYYMYVDCFSLYTNTHTRTQAMLRQCVQWPLAVTRLWAALWSWKEEAWRHSGGEAPKLESCPSTSFTQCYTTITACYTKMRRGATRHTPGQCVLLPRDPPLNTWWTFPLLAPWLASSKSCLTATPVQHLQQHLPQQPLIIPNLPPQFHQI